MNSGGSSVASSSPSTAQKSNANDRNFPVKLHYMLSELEKDGQDDIVSWKPHGRCFAVHKQKEFVEQILPLWFRQSKFASFQRQLNLYGFKRITAGHDKNCYYNELFLRGKRSLASKIQRTKIKGTGTRKPGCPSTEPNFYLAPFLPKGEVDDNVVSEEESEPVRPQATNGSRPNNNVEATGAISENAASDHSLAALQLQLQLQLAQQRAQASMLMNSGLLSGLGTLGSLPPHLLLASLQAQQRSPLLDAGLSGDLRNLVPQSSLSSVVNAVSVEPENRIHVLSSSSPQPSAMPSAILSDVGVSGSSRLNADLLLAVLRNLRHSSVPPQGSAGLSMLSSLQDSSSRSNN